jgi:hypothetical protein
VDSCGDRADRVHESYDVVPLDPMAAPGRESALDVKAAKTRPTAKLCDDQASRDHGTAMVSPTISTVKTPTTAMSGSRRAIECAAATGTSCQIRVRSQ